MDQRYMNTGQGSQGFPVNGHHPPPMYIPPRIPVTSSILYAHAIMMGSGAQGEDSLHRALFIAPYRVDPDHRIWMPALSREKSTEGLRKGTVFFWDPLAAPNPSWTVPKDPALNTQVRKRLYPLSLTYDEFIKQNPCTVGANHYKGHLVYGNFGYLFVGDRWADPDSQGDLANAYKGHPEEHRLPEIYRSEANGAQVMDPSELNKLYDDFADEVSDNEGDPRAQRLNLATYAKWAQGAVRGDRYEEDVVAVQSPLPKEVRNHKSQPKTADVLKQKLQFDLETGSMLSGVYDADEAPSLILSPLGVDVCKTPIAFSQNSPTTAARIDREMYLTGWIDQQLEYPSRSTVSTPETFYSHRGHKNMATVEDPDAGIEEYNRQKSEILELRKEADESITKTNLQLEQTSRLGNEYMEKRMEGFFIERRATETPALEAALTNSLQTREHRHQVQATVAGQVTTARKQARELINITSAARLREFERAQMPTTAKHQHPAQLPEQAPVNISSAILHRDFKLAQEPLNSLSFEELATRSDLQAKAAVPMPGTRVSVLNPAEDPQKTVVVRTGPLRSYIPDPPSPTPDLEKRRVRSQYRRHLAHLNEQEQINIAQSNQHREKYIQDQVNFDKGIEIEGKQNAENLKKMGVDKMPLGLVPSRKNLKPQINFVKRSHNLPQQFEAGH